MVGTKYIADGLVELGSGGGQTYNNSRVISDSGNGSTGFNGSASGDGMGFGNTYGGTQAYGGIEPRGNQSAEGITEPSSNSGDNAPVNSGPEIQPVVE